MHYLNLKNIDRLDDLNCKRRGYKFQTYSSFDVEFVMFTNFFKVAAFSVTFVMKTTTITLEKVLCFFAFRNNIYNVIPIII